MEYKLTHADYAEEYKEFTNTSSNIVKTLYQAINDIGHRGSGKGSYYHRLQQTMSRFDRFGQNPLSLNQESVGLTFITRPKLNLTSAALKAGGPIMATLNTDMPTTVPFGIRCFLDTNYAHRGIGGKLSADCPWFDSTSGFINPLSNNLMQIHGWPDFDLAVAASEDGFFSENQTIARGSDFLNQQYELTLTFTDAAGGPILSLLYYWVYWIALLCRGDVWRYMEDTTAHRLSYTCSIYRLVLDTRKMNITSWSKATGCFPRSIPFGQKFDISSRTHFLDALQEFSVPFVANHISYMNPNHLMTFNRLVNKYAGPIYDSSGTTLRNGRTILPYTAEHNFKGIPFIDTWSGNWRLMWLGDKYETANTLESTMATLRTTVAQETARLAAARKAKEAASADTSYSNSSIDSTDTSNWV